MSEGNPQKRYTVYLPKYNERETWDEDKFNRNKEQLFKDYEDAVVYETSPLNNEQQVADTDAFRVYLPKFNEAEVWDGAKLSRNREQLLKDYPDAEISHIRQVDYWGDKLGEISDRIGTLNAELKGIPQDESIQEDPRVIHGNSISEMQDLMQSRRESQHANRRREIKRELDQLYRMREENPAWQQYWNAQKQDISTSLSRVDQLKKIDSDTRKGPSSLDRALSAFDNYYLSAAEQFYNDARKVVDAPSRYGGDDKGALQDFWKGVADTGWTALSIVDLAQKRHYIPLLETIKKIQENEGKDANVLDLVNNNLDQLTYMSNPEKEMLRAFVKKAEVESGRSETLSRSYQAGQSAAKSLGFMADFLVAGGIGTKAAEKLAGNLVKKAGRNELAKIGAESLYGLTKAAAMTPFMPSTYANFVQNIAQFNDAGGIDISGKAIARAAGDVLIENVSETIGSKPMEIIGLPLSKVKFPAWAKAMRNSPISGALKEAGYNGLFEEMVEEWTGNALRVMTGVDKDALKDFATIDQQLITLGSFAPMSLFGGAMSTAQFTSASKAMKKAGASLQQIIDATSIPDDLKKSMLDVSEYETPEDFAHHMTDVYRSIVDSGGDAKQAYRAIMNFTDAASRYKVMDGVFEEQKDIDRSRKLTELDEQMGNENWHHEGRNGASFVRIITDQSGNERFVCAEDEAGLALVDREGNKTMLSSTELEDGITNGTLTDSGEQYLFDYLDNVTISQKEAEEAERIQQETKQNTDELLKRVWPGLNIGTEENPETVIEIGPDTIITQDEGGVNPYTYREMGDKLGIRMVPETDAEKEAKAVALEEKRANVNSAMKQFKGKHIVLPGIADMGYTLVSVVRNTSSEQYPYSVFYRDSDGHEAGTGVSDADMDAILAQMEEEQQTGPVLEVEPDVEVPDNVPRDFRGNPLPLRQNEQTGEQVVDEDALRKKDIEAWVRYNDANPARKVSSRDWLTYNIGRLTKSVEKAANDIRKAALEGVNEREMDKMEADLAAMNQTLTSYQSAMDKYTSPDDVEGDMPGYLVEEPIQQPKEQPVSGPMDFRGRPIPLDDKGEIDERAFFQSSPEAWMEWNTAQMGDEGADSRGYVEAEITRLHGQINKLQKGYKKEADFKKRKEIRGQIEEAQGRIADLEKAINNVEQRRSRRVSRELEPLTVDEVIAQGIANFKGSIDREELKRETGMSDADLQGFVGGFVNEGGMSIGRLAESIKTNDDTHLTDSISDDELRSDIIEFLRGCTKWSDITNYIANKRAIQQEEQQQQAQEAIAAEQEESGPFGRIFRQYEGKAKEAVAALKKERGGEAIGALHHPEIGLIDLVWGEEGTGNSDGYGLAKLLKYHPEVVDNLQELLDDMIVVKRGPNRVHLESEKYKAIVRLTWDEQRKTWLLSAFEKKNSALDNTTDTGETLSGEQNDTATLQDTVFKNKDSEISETQQEIYDEEAKVDTNPTESQKEAGNYRKGHIKLDGYNISIEQPKGSIRSGIDEQGNPWSVTMNNTYGYIRGTEGVDGDHIDVFLSDNPEEGDIFVVDQIKPDGSFDEHKVMFGFSDMEAARKAYLSNYSEGWQGLGAITAVSREEFRKWVDSSHRKTKPFSQYVSVETIGDPQIGSIDNNMREAPTGPKQVNVESLMGALSTTGQAKLSDHTEDALKSVAEEDAKEQRQEATVSPAYGSQNKLVTIEQYEELKKKMLAKLKSQLNAGFDPEILSWGAQMAMFHVEAGARKFVDFAQRMIGDFGDAIRPYLKAIYNGARYMPGMQELSAEMDSVADVDAIDENSISTAQPQTEASVPAESDEQSQVESTNLPDQPSDTSGQTVGEIGKYTHTKTGKEMTIVRLTGDRLSKDDFKALKGRAKEFGGYYSSFGSAKGFLFDNEGDAIKFNNLTTTENVEEQTDEQTGADTTAVVSEAASIASQAEAIAEAETTAEPGRAAEVVEKIDTALDKVNAQLALLGYYKAEEDVPFHESRGYMLSAERKAKKDADKLARALAKDLGIDLGNKKSISRANIAPAGGEIRFVLPLNNGRELYVTLYLEPVNGDDLQLQSMAYPNASAGSRLDIMYRIEEPSAQGLDKYGANNWAPYNVTYEDLLIGIRRAAKDYLPQTQEAQQTTAVSEESVEPATVNGPIDLLQVAKEQAEKVRKKAKSTKKDVSSQKEGDEALGGLFAVLDEQQEQISQAAEPTQDAEVSPSPAQEAEQQTDTDNGLQRTDEPGAEGASTESVQPGGGTKEAERAGGEGEGQDGGRADSGRAGGSQSSVRDSGHRHDDSVKRNTHNNRVSKGEVVYPKTTAARFKANIAAIRLLKQLQESGKKATKEQMAVLRQFTGWGGLGGYFNNTYTGEHRELRSLLTDEEFQAAALSINTAYYTPVEIIDTMWDVARRLGFEGGTVLEGSAGIGNILASMPKAISERSEITAVELDSITGGILELLYPDAKVMVKGFEEADIPNASVDLAITNVPFGNIQMYDAKEKDITRKFGGKIHDFCIAKNVRKLREGGIGIFISTRGTLDNSSKALRQWIVNEGGCDFIGAFRLNNGTFEGTKATSDIIVVRKRVGGRISKQAIDLSETEITRRETFDTGDTEWDSKTRRFEPVKAEGVMEMNSYFVEHPENMGGKMGFGFEHGDTYRPGSSALWPTDKIDQNKLLSKWAKQFQTQADGQGVQKPGAQFVEQEQSEGTKEGQIVVNSKGEVCISRYGKAVPLNVNSLKVKGRTKAQVVEDYNALKSAINEALDYQLKNDTDEGLKPLLAKLNRAYDTFVSRYGRLNRNTAISFLRNDVDFTSIAAAEDYKESKGMDGKVTVTVKKTGIFNGRVLGARRIPTPSSARDGVIVSMNQFGRVDIPFIAEALGKGSAEVRSEILSSGLGFENPETGNVEVDYEYLSGNVREKLEYARTHNDDGRYDANIKALEKVIPAEIPAHLIEFSLGSDWLPVSLYTDYAKERFGVNDQFVPRSFGGRWGISEDANIDSFNEKNRAAGVTSESLNIRRMGHELMLAAMNKTTVQFSRTYKDLDGHSHTEHDKEAAQAAATKIDEMRDDFKEWVRAKLQADEKLSQGITKTYNDTFNGMVPKEISDTFIPSHFDGQVLTMGKDNKPFSLYPHQAKAVIRATTEPLMMAHEVGTGKTFTLITTAMEMRRLGTAKKPMIVVQNATLGQFVSSAKELYPNAKVLTISESDRTAEGRTAFYAKVKYNDWDIIVVPQSVFEMIPDSEERQRAFIQEKIDEKIAVLAQAKEAGDKNAERQLKNELEDLEYERDHNGEQRPKKGQKKDAKKDAEAKANAAARAKKQLDRRTDDVADFDDMGIDALLIDEAHAYKHLGFSTAMQRGVKGVDPSYSKKSASVYLKTRSVFDRAGWKNVVFATGTPISNTAAEIWTFMKYLMPAEVMRRLHIYYFDDFVSNFGNISQSLEFTTSGKFKENSRFASYTNLPELIRIWSSVTDTVLTREAVAAKGEDGEVEKLDDKVPVMETWTDDKGNVHENQARDIYLPQSEALVDIMTAIRARLEWYEGLSGKEKKENSSVPLVMFGLAKMAAIDPRLVDKTAQDEPLSKTNRVVEETLKALSDSERYSGTAAIFCDNFRRWDKGADGSRTEGFNIFEEIKRKLVAAGVPADQIIIMKSGMTTAAKEKIFARVNAGDARVIMGTTATLGTGVNIQERLFFEAHIDAPNRPMDYTQRMGRILRQGNLHKEWGVPVRVVRFGVEDSLDVTAYQRLSTKSKFIGSIMDGKPLLANGMEGRVLEEEEEGEFDNPVAVLSGSEYAMLKSQAERELRKLRNKKEQHRQDQIYIEGQLKYNAQVLERWKSNLTESRELLEKTEEAFPGGEITDVAIEGRKAKGEAQIAEVIKEKITKPVREKVDLYRDKALKLPYSSEEIGEVAKFKLSFNGIPMELRVSINARRYYDVDRREYVTSVKVQPGYVVPSLGIDDKTYKMEEIPGGINGLKNIVDMFADRVASGQLFKESISGYERSIARKESDNALMLQRRGKPFSDEEKLAKQEALVKDYTEKMKAEMAEKEAKYAELAKNATTKFNLDGVEVEDEDEADSAVHNREADQNAEKLDVSDPLVVAEASAALNRLARRLNLDVHLVIDAKGGEKGYYQEGNNFVTINLNNCESVDDAVETLLHEGVAHYGLRQLLGNQGMKDFIADVLKNASGAIRNRIQQMAEERGWSLDYAAEEYIAELAEKTDYTKSERNFWRRVIDAVRNFIDIITGRRNRITDDTIREMLRSSYNSLALEPTQYPGESDVDFAVRSVNAYYDHGYKSIARDIIIEKGGRKDPAGRYEPDTDNFTIFAYPHTPYSEYEGTVFHENLHAYLTHLGINDNDPGITGFIEFCREKKADEIAKMEMEISRSGHYEGIENEELFVRLVEDLMVSGRAEQLFAIMPEQTRKLAENYINTIGYDTEQERRRRVLEELADQEEVNDNEARVRNYTSEDESVFLAQGEGIVHYRRRTKPAPTKTGIGYKVFYRGRDGKLYPPMVANPGGEDTPVGVWLDADAAPVAGQSKTGRPQVKAGGKGTQGGSGRLAYRPGWHLGEIPYAIQFNRINPETGRKELFPRDFVWAEVEYAADNDYQQEAEAGGTNANGNYQHSLAGLKRVPEDGFYRYRTNPNPETDPWIITGAMKVNRILTDEEVDDLVRAAGREPQEREPVVRNRQARVDVFISNAEAAVGYEQSNEAKRAAVEDIAAKVGVQIELRPSKEMFDNGKPLAGRWINGKMYICLEHCRDTDDSIRTVLHEAVGHNGLRRLIGNENMRDFCLDMFRRLPKQARDAIAKAAVERYGLDIAEATEEYLAERAEVMDFENEDYERSFWDIVRDGLRNVLSKIGINVPLSECDVRWLMWQSYNANRQDDLLNFAKRQVVANTLGFTLRQQEYKAEGIQIARNREALDDELDAATDAYNEAAASLWNRMKETFVDQYQSVGKLVSAIENATGKKAASFEDIRLALNRHSSKALATMQKWIGKYNTPMWDAIKEIRTKIGGTVGDISRYVMLKHGLERNEVFAKRDAREYYQALHDRAVNEIKADKDLPKEEKDKRISNEDVRLEKHLKAIEAGTNAKYREFRQRDYGGLTSFYSEYDEVDPQRPGEGKERYNARLQKARHPKYTTFDENGREVVDLAATEKAAADEVAAFERQSEGLTDKLWQRINAATKATLEHQYQSNMLSRKQYEQVRDMFKYYVPLRGFEDDTAQDLYSYYNEDQRGNFERPLIRATGRKTRAESPFGHIGAIASSGIAADMKNETKLSLYYFVSNRPNDLVTISEVWYEKTGETDEDGRAVFKAVYPSFSEDLSSEEAKKAFDDWEEGMREKAKSGLAFKGKKNLDLHNAVIHIDKGQKMEHVIKFKVGGRDMMMYVNGNPRAAQAINGELNYNAENNFFVRAFNAVLRTMAALNTALNPEFWISNFQRDALFSLMSVDVKEGSKYRDAFAKNLVSGRTIFTMKKAFDKGTLGDSKDEQLFREFAENGGITGYTVVYDNEYWEKKLDEYAGKDRNMVARFNDVFKSISDFGEAVEIRTRFAAYKTSRETGKDIISSVNDAKELTVNFNRKGSGKAITLEEAAKLRWKNGKPLSKPWQLVASMFSSISPLGRRIIMFFNAAVQGLNAMIKLYKNNPKRMAFWSAGYLAVGMINAVLHSMLDDDDDYLDIPDWERRNNLLLGGKGAYLKWALPQEARVFYALGDMVVNHALGREPHKYLAVELLDAVGEALPIDVASGVGAFLPSAAMPVIDIVLNKDYKGAKVHNDRRFYSEEERKDIPKWRNPLANTGGLYVGLAKMISSITGGDDYAAGWWNPDPNDIEHLVEGYTGGLGTTVEKMLQFFGDISRREFVVRDTPFLRRILVLNDERYRNTHTTELYYYYQTKAEGTKRQIREARKAGDVDKLDRLFDGENFEIMSIFESYKGMLKYYTDELKATTDSKDRKALMREQDAVRKEMIQEISNIGK